MNDIFFVCQKDFCFVLVHKELTSFHCYYFAVFKMWKSYLEAVKKEKNDK